MRFPSPLKLPRLIVRMAGAASGVGLVIKRITNPASDGDQTRIDFQNAAGTVLARIAAYRDSATAWGFKFYGSNTSALVSTPTLEVQGSGVVMRGAVAYQSPLAASPALYLLGYLLMDNSQPIVTGLAPGGAPVANGLYADNTPKAWAQIYPGSFSGFNINHVNHPLTGRYDVFWSRAFANTTYAVVVSPSTDSSGSYPNIQDYHATVTAKNTTNCTILIEDRSGVLQDAPLSLIAFGFQ